MRKGLTSFARWLHLQWPAGSVEALPEVASDFSTSVPGLSIVGDLTGTPLLKFALDSGTKVVRDIVVEPTAAEAKVVPLVIIGAGVAGCAAAVEAKRRGIEFRWLERSRLLDTLENFPVGKPIFSEPETMQPAGELQLSGDALYREGLLDQLKEQVAAHGLDPIQRTVDSVERVGGKLQVKCEEGDSFVADRVVVAVGRGGEHRRLDVAGEELGHVSNRLHDPADFSGQPVVVVGGGDSACEAALALAAAGAEVTLVHRGEDLVTPKQGNQSDVRRRSQRPGLSLHYRSTVSHIGTESITVETPGGPIDIAARGVFVLIGREAPVDFLRRSGVAIRGEWTWRSWLSLAFVMVFFTLLYHWKRTGVWPPIGEWWSDHGGFPAGVDGWWQSLGGQFSDGTTLLGALTTSVSQAGFWYSLVYTLLVLIFGLRRIRRRPAPYIRRQTWCLVAIQAFPLFLLPYLILPWLGNLGFFDAGWGKTVADSLFPLQEGYAPGREYWRAFGLILAWPLFFWNLFTEQPLMAWLIISALQTFVLLPLAIRRWGKGVYCGWICSCGALAETLGDHHRHKMPRGRWTQYLNFVGQFLLLLCLIMLLARLWSWSAPTTAAGIWCHSLYQGILHGIPLLSYEWTADLFLSGILGVGLYWHFSGRVWCRFACPLAALMNIYSRFSRFRIISDKKRCISCNVCTEICHQGIDVMGFARRGIPMEDPQCVRCGACVHDCPTRVLRFGEVDGDGRVVRFDSLEATI